MDEYPERLFIGEVIAPVSRMMAYYSKDGRSGLHLPFNNQLMKTKPWDARMMDSAIDQYLDLLPVAPTPTGLSGAMTCRESPPAWVRASRGLRRCCC